MLPVNNDGRPAHILIVIGLAVGGWRLTCQQGE
jgi:hypothetical protein